MIEVCTYPLTYTPVFSILIPSWNNLDFLRLCIHSIKKNSQLPHQIIVHVNEGADGTREWLKQQHIDHTFSSVNTGICLGMNAAASLAAADYLLYLNDDMYVCPQWDVFLYEEIKKINSCYFYLSATMIEPRKTGNPCVVYADFGSSVSSFRENELLEALSSLPSRDWAGATWPPSLMHRMLWNLIGGFSIEFSPGMYSDPDISMKLWKAGVRYFKGVGRSKVYHFMSKTTGRINKNPGRKQFLHKWQMSSSTFLRFYLNLGQPFSSPAEIPSGLWFKMAVLKDKIKLMLP